MVLTFLEAYELTGEARYLKRAREVLEFVVSGWDEELGGGIWWHQLHKDGTKNTCANGPAAVGCIRLAFHDKKDAARWIGEARRIVAWTNKTLQAANGLYSDSINAATGKINTDQLTYNVGLMLRAHLGLYAATGEAPFLDEAKRIGEAARSLFDPPTGAYRDALKWSHLMVEADLELWRWTQNDVFLQRAASDSARRFATWKKEPPKDLLANASLARQLWLLADHRTAAGRAFWKKADSLGVATPP